MNEIIVFGKLSFNTLGVVRSLGEKNISFFLLLLSSKGVNYICASKYVRNYKKVKTIAEGLAYIFNKKSKIDTEKTIIIPTSDNVASELDKHYDFLNRKYIFPNVGKQGGINYFMDKHLMREKAMQSGLYTPVTLEYILGDIIPDNIPFPCIVKPLRSIEGSKKEIRICNTMSQLQDFFKSSLSSKKFLVQEYIEKEYDILLIGCRLPNGETFIPALLKKQRWFSEGEDGSFGMITTHVNQYIDENLVRSFLDLSNYCGPFSIEFGVRNNTPYFFEINLRNDGTSHYFNKANINIPYIWAMGCSNNKHIDDNIIDSIEYYFIDEFGDILNVFANKISFSEWLTDLKRSSVFKYFDRKDLKPFIGVLPNMVLRIIYRIIKQLLK